MKENVVSTKTKKKFSFRFNRGQLCIPYALFLVLFVIFPTLVIFYYAFTSKTGSISFENFIEFFKNPMYFRTILTSLGIAFLSTIGCLLIGYPVAYVLSRIKSHRKTILLLLFIMPMWINFVLRANAMKELLNLIGLSGKNDYLCTVIGMIYDYLPFMILPLYSTLIKIETNLEEAAYDLGADSKRVFTKVTLPLSMPGIASGITMVFLPVMTCYVISDMYGGGKIEIIGGVIDMIFGQQDYNLASVISIVMLLIMLIGSLIAGKFSSKETTRGTILWKSSSLFSPLFLR